MESSSSRPYSLIPFGPPGAGKSNLCNLLVGEQSRFKSSNTAESGQTQNISFFEAPAFGVFGKKRLQVWDAPGVGDFNISLD